MELREKEKRQKFKRRKLALSEVWGNVCVYMCVYERERRESVYFLQYYYKQNGVESFVGVGYYCFFTNFGDTKMQKLLVTNKIKESPYCPVFKVNNI